MASLDGSARNEEPFIINPVNRLGSQVLVPGYFEGAGVYTVRGVRDGPIDPIAALLSQYLCDNWKVNAMQLTAKCPLAGSCL